MSTPPRKSRIGPVALLGVVIALVAAYLGNCFQGLGFAPGNGTGAREVKEGAAIAKKKVGEATDAAARARVTVQGERCRLGDEATPRDCDAVCKEVDGTTAEVEATAGAQRTVEALRTCLQGRGLKVQVVSE